MDEKTLLQAYKSNEISPHQIWAAGKLRREASARLGQKIGVISAHGTPGEEHGSSLAYTPFIIGQNIKSAARHGERTEIRDRPRTGTDRLRQRFFYEKPFVELNVGNDSEGKKRFVPTLGHELGHVVDPVQSEKFHAMSDLEGRNEMFGAYNGSEPTQNELSVMKSEGRAWRMGRDMQKAVGLDSPDPVWKEAAQRSLHSYTRPYRKG